MMWFRRSFPELSVKSSCPQTACPSRHAGRDRPSCEGTTAALRDPCTHHQGSGGGCLLTQGVQLWVVWRDEGTVASHILCVSPTPRLGRTCSRCPTPFLCPAWPGTLLPLPSLVRTPLTSPQALPSFCCPWCLLSSQLDLNMPVPPTPPAHKGPHLCSPPRLRIPSSVSPLSAVDLVTSHICL